ncbi:MAG: hypothetical protein ACREIC_06105, partial [Limisphaerales bacterium]
MDYFPGGVMAAALAVALSLPVICFFTIAVQPSVYLAWLDCFRQIRSARVELVIKLWRCLSRENAIHVARSIARMKVCPATADDWFALLLFPFKAYVLMAIPFLTLGRAVIMVLAPSARGHFSEVSGPILDG